MNFAQILSVLISQYNMSNYRLAKILSVSQSTVANWLSGKTAPSSQKLHEISNVFNVSVDYLLGRDKNDVSLADPTKSELVNMIHMLDNEDTAYIKGQIVALLKSEKYKGKGGIDGI